MTTPYRRHGQLTWPPTQEQWQSLDLELANIYRQIRNGVGGGTVDLSNLDADNLTSGTVPDAVLANTGVSAGTFGDASHVSQVTVDIKGRVTFAGNVAITGAGTVVVASVYRSTNQTLTSGTEAAITLDTVAFDSSTMWASGAATRLTVPTAQSGTYWINGQIQLDTGFAGTAHVRLYKNGTLAAETTSVGARLSSGAENHSCGALLSLIATDFVEMKVLLELATGTTFAVVGGATATFLQAMKASPQASAGGGDIRSDGTVAFAADQSMASHKITNVTDPASAQDAATKNYVDTHVSGLVLLEKHIASASSSLDFTTRNASGQSGATFQSDYDEYLLRIDSLVPATNATALMLRMSTNGGTSYDATSGNYSWASLAMAFNATGSNGSTSATAITLINDCASAAKLSQSGDFTMTGLLSTTLYKLIRGTLNQTDSTRTAASLATVMAGKYLVDATAVNACRLLMSSGNITSGTVRIYGVVK